MKKYCINWLCHYQLTQTGMGQRRVMQSCQRPCKAHKAPDTWADVQVSGILGG